VTPRDIGIETIHRLRTVMRATMKCAVYTHRYAWRRIWRLKPSKSLCPQQRELVPMPYALTTPYMGSPSQLAAEDSIHTMCFIRGQRERVSNNTQCLWLETVRRSAAGDEPSNIPLSIATSLRPSAISIMSRRNCRPTTCGLALSKTH